MNTARPVIAGTGMTGLAASISLSRAGIDHHLVGGPPQPIPKLGESLDFTSTVALVNDFPEFSSAYYPKKSAELYFGDKRISLRMNTGDDWRLRAYFAALGHTLPDNFMHVDRAELDPAMFAAAVAHAQCSHVAARVEDADVTDGRVSAVRLSTGETLDASYLFHAGRGRAVGDALGVKAEPLGPEQTVVYHHYKMPPGGGHCRDWESCTHLLQLRPEIDGQCGFIWCIPVGEWISVGLSMERQAACSTEDAVALLESSLEARGLDFFHDRVEVTEPRRLEHQYFTNATTHGPNWILAGPPACSIWFMSGSGVGLGLALAKAAPRLVRGDRTIGQKYDAYVRTLTKTHRLFEVIRFSPGLGLDDDFATRTLDRLVVSNAIRTARYFQIRGGRVEHAAAELCARVATVPGVIRNWAGAHANPFRDDSGLHPLSADPAWAAIDAILRVPAGDDVAPAVAARHLTPAVKLHFGRLPFVGAPTWALFAGAVRRIALERKLTLTITDREIVDGVHHVRARWTGPDGAISPIRVEYKMDGNRAVEIWTHPENYVPIFGPKVEGRLGLMSVMRGIAAAV